MGRDNSYFLKRLYLFFFFSKGIAPCINYRESQGKALLTCFTSEAQVMFCMGNVHYVFVLVDRVFSRERNKYFVVVKKMVAPQKVWKALNPKFMEGKRKFCFIRSGFEDFYVCVRTWVWIWCINLHNTNSGFYVKTTKLKSNISNYSLSFFVSSFVKFKILTVFTEFTSITVGCVVIRRLEQYSKCLTKKKKTLRVMMVMSRTWQMDSIDEPYNRWMYGDSNLDR